MGAWLGTRAQTEVIVVEDSVIRYVAEELPLEGRAEGFLAKWNERYNREFNKRPIGFTVGPCIKWWTHRTNGKTNRCTFFGDAGHNTGIVFGIPYQPYFKKGWGLDTGIFSEIYACKDAPDIYRVEDVNLMIPLRVMYRVPFKKEFSVYLSTGVSANIGLRLNLKNAEDTDAGTMTLNYDDNTPSRLNMLYDVAAGVHIGVFDLKVTYSVGMTPNRNFFSTNGTGENYIKVYMNRIAFTAGLLF